MNDNTKFIVCALGIFLCYFYFGILQERITRGRYGDQENEDGTVGERWTLTLALVGVQCICNWVFAKVMLLAKPQANDTTNKIYYASSSLTYLLAMISSNMALRWVPYPTQVVGKSAKPIPVMILGVLIGRKSYPMQRYVCVLLIVIGVVLFMFKEGKTATVSDEQSGMGELLLCLSLLMDGLTGALQERMRAESSPSALQMMISMNGWSSMLLGIALLLTGEGSEFISFATRYPQVLGQLATLAIAGSIGQYFIFMMVSSFGPLACSVVTTTRKFFTVLFSVLFFGNSLITRQWLGAFIVFTALFVDSFIGKKPTQKKLAKQAADK